MSELRRMQIGQIETKVEPARETKQTQSYGPVAECLHVQ